MICTQQTATQSTVGGVGGLRDSTIHEDLEHKNNGLKLFRERGLRGSTHEWTQVGDGCERNHMPRLNVTLPLIVESKTPKAVSTGGYLQYNVKLRMTRVGDTKFAARARPPILFRRWNGMRYTIGSGRWQSRRWSLRQRKKGWPA